MNPRLILLGLALAAPGLTGCRDNPLSGGTAQAQPAPAQKLPAQDRALSIDLPTLAPLVDAVRTAVINVEVKSRIDVSSLPPGHPDLGEGSQGGERDDFWDRFFGQRDPRRREEFLRQGQGSGFLIESSGLALTNNHVVAEASAITVRLEDGRRFDAEVAGRDPLTDIAVIRLKGKPTGLPTVKLGDSEAMAVGDWTVAIGNPFGLASSVSAGIISAKARQIGAGPYDNFLQTDAAINPGNSGGPLFNLKGEVIGMNTAIAGLGTGIGFAVPSNMIRTLLPQLEKGEPIVRGWLGVAIQDLTPAIARALQAPVEKGAVVADVTGNTPAAKAGLKNDDIIVAVDGQPITTAAELSAAVAGKKPGTTATLTLYRGGKKVDLPATVGTRPDLEGVQRRPRGEGGQQEERQQRLGMSLKDLDPAAARGLGISGGAIITEVRPGSPADEAELQPDWVVVEAAGRPVKNAAELRKTLKDAKKGSSLLLRLQTEQGRIIRAITIPK
ncbi:MAG: Do family serine endopeptidase [Myxococcaceae bacterium]